jgi:hypothetical protein
MLPILATLDWDVGQTELEIFEFSAGLEGTGTIGLKTV